MPPSMAEITLPQCSLALQNLQHVLPGVEREGLLEGCSDLREVPDVAVVGLKGVNDGVEVACTDCSKPP